MNLRWLIPLGAILSLNVITSGEELPLRSDKENAVPRTSIGFLHVRDDSVANPSMRTVAYEPQPGDILLYDLHSKFYQIVFKLAKTGSPVHTAMVIARDDGTPALL